jgi:phage shock protein E
MITYITVDEYKRAYDSGTAPLLVDVRDANEYAGGHIAGAINIPLDSLARGVLTEIPDKQTPVVIYCDVGIRQHHAARLLRSMGYHNVFEMQGGMLNYSRESSRRPTGHRPA